MKDHYFFSGEEGVASHLLMMFHPNQLGWWSHFCLFSFGCGSSTRKGERIPPKAKGAARWKARMCLQHLRGICLSSWHGWWHQCHHSHLPSTSWWWVWVGLPGERCHPGCLGWKPCCQAGLGSFQLCLEHQRGRHLLCRHHRLGVRIGEIAAGASLGAATCTGTPPQLTTTKISVLGDQTVRDGRRLLIGEGPVGNGVQCGVDVGMVAANIANMGLAINKAVNVNKCKASTFRVPMNVLKGIPEALCTVDIGGAVAYIGQVVTFINLIVLHCQDRLGSRQPAGGQQVASRWPAAAPCCT